VDRRSPLTDTNLGEAKEKEDELGAVLHNQGNVVSAPESGRQGPVGHLVDNRVNLLERPLFSIKTDRNCQKDKGQPQAHAERGGGERGRGQSQRDKERETQRQKQ